MKILTIIALVFASIGEYNQAGSICHCRCEQNGTFFSLVEYLLGKR